MSTSSGYCNCCAMRVPLLTEVETNESVCTVCRSYDVTRDTIRNASPRLQLREIAAAFEAAFNAFDEVRP